jgi:hypothetical protein
MQVVHKTDSPPGPAGRWLIERLMLSSPADRQAILKRRKRSDRRDVSTRASEARQMRRLELDFDHLGIVSVAEVLGNPDRFVDETLADPMEGNDYGRCKAKVLRGDDGGLFIHSFAHGGAIYRLRHDARLAKAAVTQAPGRWFDRLCNRYPGRDRNGG